MNTKTFLVLWGLLAVALATPHGPACCSQDCCCDFCPADACAAKAPVLPSPPVRGNGCFCPTSCRHTNPNSREISVKVPLAEPQQVQVVHNVAVYQEKDNCCGNSGRNCAANCVGVTGFCASCAFNWGHIIASPLLIGLCVAMIIVVILILFTCCCIVFSLIYPNSSRPFFRQSGPNTFEVVHEEETTEYQRGGGRCQSQVREEFQSSGAGSDSHQKKTKKHRFP